MESLDCAILSFLLSIAAVELNTVIAFTLYGIVVSTLLCLMTLFIETGDLVGNQASQGLGPFDSQGFPRAFPKGERDAVGETLRK